MLEALSRLKGRDLEANPALKNAVLNVLKQVDGKPAAVEIIRDFQLKDQAQALLDFALKNPTDPAAAEALKTILAFERIDLIRASLAADLPAGVLVDLLGITAENRISPLLIPLVVDPKRDVALRRRAVKSLARVQEGVVGLIALAQRQGQFLRQKIGRLRASLLTLPALQIIRACCGCGNYDDRSRSKRADPTMGHTHCCWVYEEKTRARRVRMGTQRR